MSKFSSLVLSATLMTSMVWAQDTDDHTDEALKAARFGETVYSVYLDDHLTSLTTMAVAREKGLTDEQLEVVTLLEGGVGLGWSMPSMAAAKLGQHADHRNKDNRPLAWYWLARLSFAQHQYQAGLAAYEQFEQALLDVDEDVDDVLTPSQWYDLNYEAAQAALSIGNADIEKYQTALPSDHVTLRYLEYNEAVAAYSEQNYDDAIKGFAGVEAQLVAQLMDNTDEEGWLNWIGWWQDREDDTVKQAELQALLNQVHLSHGQAMLARGRFTDALGVFGEISGQSLVRDEALLQYGWGLARRNDWPLAMGVWDYLAKQPDNLYTLQATHALALGYAQQDGEVQAHDTLAALIVKLNHSIDDLDALTTNMQTEAFWQALAAGVSDLQVDQMSTDSQSQWQTLWPAAHQDLLMSLMLKDGEQTDQLAQLEELYALRTQLMSRQSKIETFTQLLDERDLAHAKRAEQHQNSPTEARLNQLQAQIETLKNTIAKAIETEQSAATGTESLVGLAVFADESQLASLNRLNKASQRHERLLSQRKMRPKYAQRIARLQGIMLWDLSEQYTEKRWQTKKAMVALEALLQDAQTKQTSFASLVSKANITGPQRQRLATMAKRIDDSLTKTTNLIDALEGKLTANAHDVIKQRRDYLAQQRNMSKLAILQLKDSWRPTTQAAPVAATEGTDE